MFVIFCVVDILSMTEQIAELYTIAGFYAELDTECY